MGNKRHRKRKTLGKQAAIKPNNKTHNASDESDTQTRQPNIDVVRTSSVPARPPTGTHCQIICKAEKESWDKFKDYVELVGIALLAIYTAFTILMYCANKKAADAAKDAANSARDAVELSRKTLIIDQRAWVKVDFPHNQLLLDKLQKNLSVTVVASNIGKTPATSIQIDIVLEIIGDRFPPSFSFNRQHRQ